MHSSSDCLNEVIWAARQQYFQRGGDLLSCWGSWEGCRNGSIYVCLCTCLHVSAGVYSQFIVTGIEQQGSRSLYNSWTCLSVYIELQKLMQCLCVADHHHAALPRNHTPKKQQQTNEETEVKLSRCSRSGIPPQHSTHTYYPAFIIHWMD